MSQFAGLVRADFDAYAPNKWRSNVFNRERLEVKQHLLALGRELQPLAIGADGAPLAIEASVEHPALWNHKQVDAQHVFFFRNDGARKELDAIIDKTRSLAAQIEDPTPQRTHLFLAVTLTHDALEIALRLHPEARVDRQNLERKLDDHFEREKLLARLHALGDTFRCGIGAQLTPVAELDDARLAALVGELGRPAPGLTPPGAPPRFFVVSSAIARDEALAAGPALVEAVRARFQALVPVYQEIAWSRDNDMLSMREALKKEKESRRQRGLAKNDTVRIVRGMFAGKSGTVHEIDARGGLKVLVGKLAVKVDADDVVKQ
jgi:hypothetical protein